MIKLLQLLWYGHSHKWKIIEAREVRGEAWDGSQGLIGVRYTCQCEHCGKIKSFKNY